MYIDDIYIHATKKHTCERFDVSTGYCLFLS